MSTLKRHGRQAVGLAAEQHRPLEIGQTSEGFMCPPVSWIMISTAVYSRSTNCSKAASSGKSGKHRLVAATNTRDSFSA